MFVVNDMPQQVDKALLAKLGKVETATVGHFLHAQFMDPAIRAMIPEMRVAGTAVTVRTPALDGTVVHNAISMCRPGDFLVIDRCGDMRHACWGGVTVHAGQCVGIAGVVVDGMCTDLSEIRKVGVPIWCRGPSPITVKRAGVDGQINIPVSCGGVTVRPGDVILGDESGVLVLDPAEAEAVADRALAMQDRELVLLKRLHAGEKLADVTGAAEQLRQAMEAQKKG